jgi:hypothetical protein
VPIVTIVKHKTGPAGHTGKPTSGICFGVALTGMNQSPATLYSKAGGGLRKGIPRSVSCLLYATLQPGPALSSLHHPVSLAEGSDIFLRPNVERFASEPEHSLFIPDAGRADCLEWRFSVRSFAEPARVKSDSPTSMRSSAFSKLGRGYQSAGRQRFKRHTQSVGLPDRDSR